MKLNFLPKLQNLPNTLPAEGAISLELQEGVPIFRSSSLVQSRIETLLERQQLDIMTAEEEQELDMYEAIDDYISLVNRVTRNTLFSDTQQSA
jgi:hypothetical protein